jgi:hypothetical protein
MPGQGRSRTSGRSKLNIERRNTNKLTNCSSHLRLRVCTTKFDRNVQLRTRCCRIVHGLPSAEAAILLEVTTKQIGIVVCEIMIKSLQTLTPERVSSYLAYISPSRRPLYIRRGRRGGIIPQRSVLLCRQRRHRGGRWWWVQILVEDIEVVNLGRDFGF